MKTRHVLLMLVISIAFLLLNFQPVVTADQTREENLGIVKNLVVAKQKAWQLSATEADVDYVLGFYSDSLELHHVVSPAKRFSFRGKELIRRGMISHLGETRNVEFKILKSIVIQNVVIIETRMKRQVKTSGGWIQQSSAGVSIYKFDSLGKINSVEEYL